MDYDDTPSKDPREENIAEMYKFTLCPQLKWTSFVTLVVLIDIACFLAQIFVDGIVKGGKLLDVSPYGKVIQGFGKMREPVHNKFEVHRLFTCLLLHGNFSHIFNNSFSTIIWGSLIEKHLGFKKTCLIYILAGIIGNLFSIIYSKPNEIGIGASTSVFSFFGILVGFLVLNWYRFEGAGYNLGRVILNIFVILLLNVFMLSSDKSIDNYAHGGGFVAGITLSMLLADLPEKERQPMSVYEKRVKQLGLLATIAFTAFSASVFFIGK